MLHCWEPDLRVFIIYNIYDFHSNNWSYRYIFLKSWIFLWFFINSVFLDPTWSGRIGLGTSDLNLTWSESYHWIKIQLARSKQTSDLATWFNLGLKFFKKEKNSTKTYLKKNGLTSVELSVSEKKIF